MTSTSTTQVHEAGRGGSGGSGGLGAVHASSAILYLNIVALLTFSYWYSTIALGPLPISIIMLVLLVFAYRQSVAEALRTSRPLRMAGAFWTIWMIVTIARVVVDYSEYQQLAYRDSVITVSFLSVFLGAAIAFRFDAKKLDRAIESLLAILAIYAVIYPLRQLAGLDWPVLSVQNMNVAGVALIGGAMWAERATLRVLCLAMGATTLFLTQSRGMYLAAIFLVVIYLALRSTGRARNGAPNVITRVVGLIGASAIAVVLVVGIGATGLVEGRVGAASLSSVVALVDSVFDDSSELAGSRQSREEWREISTDKLFESPATVLSGAGLGVDLAGGFAIEGTLIRKPHNDFLETATRFGLPVGAGFAWLFIYAGSRVRRQEMRTPANLILTGWLAASVINALAQPYYSYPHGAIPAGIVIGILMARSSLLPAKDRLKPFN